MTRRAKRPKTPYRSGFESKGAKFLEEQGIPFEYENLKITYIVPEKRKTYNPDFMLPNGIILEYKGKLDRDVREKMALAIEQNPTLDIRFVFMRDNKIAKNSKTRYSDWCKKRGIKYAVSEDGIVPQEWLDEARAVHSLDVDSGVPAPVTKRTRKTRPLDGC